MSELAVPDDHVFASVVAGAVCNAVVANTSAAAALALVTAAAADVDAAMAAAACRRRELSCGPESDAAKFEEVEKDFDDCAAASKSAASDLTAAQTASADAAIAVATTTARAANKVVIKQSGLRHSGCDESSGWIWHSAYALEAAILDEACLCWADQQVLELGSGTGWFALRLAQLGAEVTATDRPGAMDVLIRNVMRNQERFATPDVEGDAVLRVQCAELLWEVADPASEAERIGGPWDWVLCSDVIYYSDSHAPLLATLGAQLRRTRGDGRRATRALLAFEERKPAEEAIFFELASSAGLTCDRLLSDRSFLGAKGECRVLRLTLTEDLR